MNTNAKLLHKWQKEALTPVAAARGAELDPTIAAELRQLRALARWQAQELNILKNYRQQTLQARYISDTRPMNRYRFIEKQWSQHLARLLCHVMRALVIGYYA